MMNVKSVTCFSISGNKSCKFSAFCKKYYLKQVNQVLILYRGLRMRLQAPVHVFMPKIVDSNYQHAILFPKIKKGCLRIRDSPLLIHITDQSKPFFCFILALTFMETEAVDESACISLVVNVISLKCSDLGIVEGEG